MLKRTCSFLRAHHLRHDQHPVFSAYLKSAKVCYALHDALCLPRYKVHLVLHTAFASYQISILNMRQGSILTFLRPQTSSPSTKEAGSTSGLLVVTQVPKDLKNGEDGTEHLCHDDPQRASQSTLPNVIKHDLHNSNAAITTILPSHIHRLKSITATLLPVRYSDKFFLECLEPEKHSAVAFVALYDSQVVGWIRGRVEPFPNAENEVYQQIYLQALGILAPYRGLGLAAELLKAVNNQALSSYPKVRSMYAHVWESNDDALGWYDKQDFRRIMLQPQYYRRLKPSGAWMVRLELD